MNLLESIYELTGLAVGEDVAGDGASAQGERPGEALRGGERERAADAAASPAVEIREVEVAVLFSDEAWQGAAGGATSRIPSPSPPRWTVLWNHEFTRISGGLGNGSGIGYLNAILIFNNYIT